MYKQKTSFIFVILTTRTDMINIQHGKFTVDIYINHISELFIFPLLASTTFPKTHSNLTFLYHEEYIFHNFGIMHRFYRPIPNRRISGSRRGTVKAPQEDAAGKILIVTNLNDSGEGSLRNAIQQKGARTVLFAVDGTIELKSPLRINNDSITIAGQSAPGDGICLRDYPLTINASNVIVRYITVVRVGDRHNRDSDGVGGGRYGQKNVILDHISVKLEHR